MKSELKTILMIALGIFAIIWIWKTIQKKGVERLAMTDPDTISKITNVANETGRTFADVMNEMVENTIELKD